MDLRPEQLTALDYLRRTNLKNPEVEEKALSYVQAGYGTDPDGNQHDMTKLIFKL